MDAEERAKKIKEREEQIKERNNNDIAKLLQLTEGRRFYYRVLKMLGTFGVSPSDGRATGLTLFREVMEIAPQRYIQMDGEYKSEIISIKKQFPVDPDEE